MSENLDPKAVEAFLRAHPNFLQDRPGLLAALNLPALVIHGDRDTSAPLPLTGLRTAELVSGAQTSIYEGAPHGLPLTHRRRFNADLLTFMGT